VKSGYGGLDQKHDVQPDFTFDTLLEAVRFIASHAAE
jgi:hypothetical protein